MGVELLSPPFTSPRAGSTTCSTRSSCSLRVAPSIMVLLQKPWDTFPQSAIPHPWPSIQLTFCLILLMVISNFLNFLFLLKGLHFLPLNFYLAYFNPDGDVTWNTSTDGGAKSWLFNEYNKNINILHPIHVCIYIIIYVLTCTHELHACSLLSLWLE